MDFVEQLKASVRIETVVGEYVRLRRSGPSRYMGLCPFHNEKKPSFTVHVVHQFYKCFSCGVSGDVIKFVQEKEGLSFFEALKTLAERYGIPMPKRSQYSDDESRLRGSLFEMHEMAQQVFRANLAEPAGETARQYLARRGVAPETIEHFGLGYSERGGRSLVRLFEQRNFSAAQMEESGLVSKRSDGSFYDRFRNRLMFPIHNEAGKIIGFGGRALSPEDEPKYLNSPETPIYKKSYVLYNLHRAKEVIRKEDRVILVEGYMDAIGVTAAGFGGVVASCGTSLTTQQVQALKRHSQRVTDGHDAHGTVIVNFDPDAPGANAAERSINLLLEEGLHVRIMELDGGLDPDEYCKQRGPAAYRERMENATGFFYWLADRARKKYDIRSSEGLVAILQALLPSLHRIADPLERSAVAGDLASYIGVPQGMVLDSFRRSAANREEKTVQRPKAVLRADERMLLNAVLGDSEMRPWIVRELQPLETVSRFATRHIFETIFALEDAGERVAFDSLHARLEESDQNLLADVVLSVEEEVLQDRVEAALESVRLSDGQQRREQLKARIKESERAGKWEEALRLTAELQNLLPSARGRG
jgi:DNA primase